MPEDNEMLQAAHRVRAELITMTEAYTGKPIEVFAEEVRTWRRSHMEQDGLKLPFPATAYCP